MWDSWQGHRKCCDSQLPKSGTAGHGVITGNSKDRDAAREYFQDINQFTKDCGFHPWYLIEI